MPAFPIDPKDGALDSVPDAALALCTLANSLVVADEAGAVHSLEMAASLGGAEAALFVWVTPEGDGRWWFRSLAALDPHWSATVLRSLHEGPCTWLAHAARSSEPVMVPSQGAAEREADPHGEGHETNSRRSWLIPAPSPPSSDALGLLILSGGWDEGSAATTQLLPVYRALALALAEWQQRRAREELVSRAHLTSRDLDLLRHESMGHGSKRIAAALDAEPKTIDCRFHRLNARLGVANRRDAVRLCRRYGLL